MGEILLQVNYRIKNNHWLWENSAFKVNYIVPTNDRRKYTLRPDYYDVEQNMPINQWGERTTLQAENYEDTRNVIVCLGDSVPFGAGIGNKDTYLFYLAQNLTSEGFKYYVINAGVPSYNLRQSFDRLKFDIYNHVDEEDVKVITIQAANDISLPWSWKIFWFVSRPKPNSWSKSI
ncbi:MAG: SGNH/GDSL hydrolase family protein [Pelolinea sp.]|nr:SGNH/GDSL hydrolase family protein [Pelolinea sp.]